MMPISKQAIDEAVGAFVYARDERKAPDEHRRGKFRVGWEDASQGRRTYTAEALERLTWMNMGYRLGQRFGHLTPSRINAVYDYLAECWNQRASGDRVV